MGDWGLSWLGGSFLGSLGVERREGGCGMLGRVPAPGP